MGKRKARKADRRQGRQRDSRPGRDPLLRWAGLVILAACAVLGWDLATRAKARAEAPPVYGYEIVNVFPHDPAAFCQGLLFRDGFLFESTGRYGGSSLRRVKLESGRVLKHVALSPRLFGEGIALFGDDVIQLTWRSRLGIIYDADSFARRGTFRYTGEGWGITSVGERLVMSDGSSTLRFLDPETFRVLHTITVHSGGVPVDRLNELEYVEGEIYANVWESDRIARISPTTGEVLGWIDLGGLLARRERVSRDAVLNGIAYDAGSKRLFVTGKLWPKLFEIRLVRKR